ncbi:MAG: nitrilase-related carbon-nitrogen hydrolase [Blastocatellia bacterium]
MVNSFGTILMPRMVTVAAVQATPMFMNLEASLAKALNLVAEAALKKAQLVVFPEAWLPGYPAWLEYCRDVAVWNHPPVKKLYARLVENSVIVPGPTTEALSAVAAENRLTIVMGVCERVVEGAGRGTLYSSMLTFGPNDAAAAQITTIAFWVRPCAAIVAGVLADRLNTLARRVITLSFCLLLVSGLTLASGSIQPGFHWLLVATVAGTSAGIFAVRGVFFALFQEARVPLAITGSAVGMVSLLGYTPDVFMPAPIGYLLIARRAGWGINRSLVCLPRSQLFDRHAAFSTHQREEQQGRGRRIGLSFLARIRDFTYSKIHSFAYGLFGVGVRILASSN